MVRVFKEPDDDDIISWVDGHGWYQHSESDWAYEAEMEERLRSATLEEDARMHEELI